MSFRTCDNKGFHITFANGYTVSVQFGPGNYCDNYNEPFLSFEERGRHRGYQSTDAEIAAWGPDGKMQEWPGWGENVKGHVTANELLEFMQFLAALPAAVVPQT